MSDTADAPNAPRDNPPTAPVRLLGQFIKDLSFEVPNAPEIFNILRQSPPEIPITMDTGMRHLSGGTYEVTLSVNIAATAAGKAAFILEVIYACIVEVDEKLVPQEAIHPLLLMEIPRQMFPFVRQIIGDMTVNGGFPPLMMQLVDFADLYRQKFGVAGQPVETQAPPNATIN